MSSFRNKLALLVFVLLVACGFLSALGAEGRSPIRAALMDFAVDDNSYRSAQAAASFSSLLQVELAKENGLQWVERAQLELAKQELRLSEMDLLSGTSDIRRGKWVKADWLVTGRFSLDDQSRRILFLEITDLQHADVLASETVPLSGMAMTPMNVEAGQVQIAVAAMRRLFTQARDRGERASGQVIIAPLFFVDLGDQQGTKECFESLKYAYQDFLERLASTNARFRVIRFPKAYRAMDEAEMLVDGLVEWDSQAWETPADLCLWGSYSMSSSFTYAKTNGIQSQQYRTRHQLSFRVWDGVSAPVPIELDHTVPGRDRLSVKEADAFWERLGAAMQERASTQRKGAMTGAARREIADSMVKTFIRVHGNFDAYGIYDVSRFLDQVRLIETACFLDPGNQEAQALRISSRWGAWVDSGSAVKNQFLSKWRRSNAWGKYAERFGLGPVKAPLHFPGYPEGIPGVYVGSLAEVVNMVPEGTGSAEAQRRGFPRDVPAERIAEWKAQLVAELAERKRRVGARASSLANTNAVEGSVAASSGAPASLSANNLMTNASTDTFRVAGLKPAVKNEGNQGGPAGRPIPTYVPAIGTNRTPSPRQTASTVKPPPVEVVTGIPRTPSGPWPQAGVGGQPWRRQVGETTTLFQLHAPELWPVEVAPALTEIKFPAHFESKTILKIVPWQDQLVMLVVDERSAPTSDPNPDIMEELLTKAGRLWAVPSGQANPRLLEARGMPESVCAFLIEKDQLWVAGKVFGHLDLKDRSFHTCQRGGGPDAPEDHVLAASGGRLYTAQQFGLSSYDPVSSGWKQLPRPGGRALMGYGAQVSLAANERWLCYGAGETVCYDLANGSWTNVPSVSMIRCLGAEKAGFWMGGRSGLHFYEPEAGSLRSWCPPMKFEGIWDVWRPPNLKLLAEAPGDVATGYSGHIPNSGKIFQERPRGKDAMAHYPKVRREPLRLDSHVPGAVTSLVRDGDSLWLGIADRLLLLDLPSRSLVACCRSGGKPVASIGVSDEFVWLGLAFGEQLLVRIPKREFYAVPKSQWTPLAITADERRHLIASMSVRDQAIHAFYGGDAKRVVELLGNLNPANAKLEEMLLLAVTYGAVGIDDPKQVLTWCERIIGRYPGSPWATYARKAMEESDHTK